MKKLNYTILFLLVFDLINDNQLEKINLNSAEVFNYSIENQKNRPSTNWILRNWEKNLKKGLETLRNC